MWRRATHILGCVAAIVAGLVAALAVAGVAFAHVEVQATPDVAGARNALLTFIAEAESPTSGIVSVRIVLPAGITPADVELENAPSGWRLSLTKDGYTVAGPALPAQEPAVHAVNVAHLPDTTTLYFKALVTYANGDVDRWIEEPSIANPYPDNPAAVLILKAGPSTLASSGGRATSTATTPGGSGASSGTGGPGGWLWLLVALLVVGAAFLLVALRRRARGAAPR